MSDAETLAMVRQTAHDVFKDVPTAGQLADLGWYGLFTPEHLGGSGWRPREACAIAEEAGAAYNPGSWVEIALAASALAVSPESGFLDAVLSGETSASFCTGRIALGGGTPPRVSGTFPFSAGLPAQVIVVTDENGSVGAAVHGHDGVTLNQQDGCLDTTRSFHCLRLHEADAVPIDAGELGWLTTTAQLLSCADTIGALRRAIAAVTDHLLERQAFGSSLASFQVIQHRLVDLEVLHASAQALVQRAAEAVEEKSDTSLVDAAHVFVASRAVPALEDCIQLSGGMGFTWEFPVHHTLRRALTNGSMMRTRRTSNDRLALARGWS